MVRLWNRMKEQYDRMSRLGRSLTVLVLGAIVTVVTAYCFQGEEEFTYRSEVCDTDRGTGEGHLITESRSEEVWIVKIGENTSYRRLLPAGINSVLLYDKEGCDVKVVSSVEFESYDPSSLVHTEVGQPVYRLFPFTGVTIEQENVEGQYGRKETVADSIDDLDTSLYDRDSVFEILESELELYSEW